MTLEPSRIALARLRAGLSTGAWTTVTAPAAALRADVEHHRHHREGLIHMAPTTHTPMMATRLHLNLGQSIIWPHRPEAQGGHS